MYASTFFLAASAASAVLAAPAYSNTGIADTKPGTPSAVAEYFSLMAEKVHAARQVLPVCDLSQAVFPSNDATPALPPPSSGLVLKHVAIGRGTQNYTCDTSNATAIPVPTGALATLFNASCLAATFPDLLNLVPAVVIHFNLSNNAPNLFDTRLFPTNLALSGHHYFLDATTPFFDLDTPSSKLGRTACAKNSTQVAPAAFAPPLNLAADSPPPTSPPSSSDAGQKGEPAVPWLKLNAKVSSHSADAQTDGLAEVYRLQTVGGSAPKTCKNMPAEFYIQYASQYWFFEKA